MCGRFACAVDRASVCRACQYTAADGQVYQPIWRNNTSAAYYRPSANVAPTNYSPVLLSAEVLDNDSTSGQPSEGSDDAVGTSTTASQRVVMPMRFGLIPSWHKGAEKELRIATINCRLEGIMHKKTFAGALKKGRRCAVLVEGFFEWEQLKSNVKQPYLLYLTELPQQYFEKELKEGTTDNNNETSLRSQEISPAQLMKLAAIFDVWQNPEGETIYSFSIVTCEPSKATLWIHDRMPAILRTEEELNQWLDGAHIPSEEALKSSIHAVDDLHWHPVTRAMGTASYKAADASVPISPKDAGKTGKPVEAGQPKIADFFSKIAKTKQEVAKQEDITPLKVVGGKRPSSDREGFSLPPGQSTITAFFPSDNSRSSLTPSKRLKKE